MSQRLIDLKSNTGVIGQIGVNIFGYVGPPTDNLELWWHGHKIYTTKVEGPTMILLRDLDFVVTIFEGRDLGRIYLGPSPVIAHRIDGTAVELGFEVPKGKLPLYWRTKKVRDFVCEGGRIITRWNLCLFN